MILFMTLWKRPSYWEENTSVLRKGWDWEEMNDYKGAQVFIKIQRPVYLKRINLIMCKLYLNKLDQKEKKSIP